MAELVLKLGDSTLGKYIFNKGEMTIGRTRENDIVLENLAVSRVHARLTTSDDRYFIEDLGSGNGTFVNRQRISKAELRHNDVIAVGKHQLIFENPTSGADILEEEPTRMVGTKSVGYLDVVRGEPKDHQFRIRGPKAILGRNEECEVSLPDRKLARKHAEIYREGDTYFIRSTARWNRLVVNGMQLNETPLKDGDEIELGETLLVFGISQEQVSPGDSHGVFEGPSPY